MTHILCSKQASRQVHPFSFLYKSKTRITSRDIYNHPRQTENLSYKSTTLVNQRNRHYQNITFKFLVVVKLMMVTANVRGGSRLLKRGGGEEAHCQTGVNNTMYGHNKGGTYPPSPLTNPPPPPPPPWIASV